MKSGTVLEFNESMQPLKAVIAELIALAPRDLAEVKTEIDETDLAAYELEALFAPINDFNNYTSTQKDTAEEEFNYFLSVLPGKVSNLLVLIGKAFSDTTTSAQQANDHFENNTDNVAELFQQALLKESLSPQTIQAIVAKLMLIQQWLLEKDYESVFSAGSMIATSNFDSLTMAFRKLEYIRLGNGVNQIEKALKLSKKAIDNVDLLLIRIDNALAEIEKKNNDSRKEIARIDICITESDASIKERLIEIRKFLLDKNKDALQKLQTAVLLEKETLVEKNQTNEGNLKKADQEFDDKCKIIQDTTCAQIDPLYKQAKEELHIKNAFKEANAMCARYIADKEKEIIAELKDKHLSLFVLYSTCNRIMRHDGEVQRHEWSSFKFDKLASDITNAADPAHSNFLKETLSTSLRVALEKHQAMSALQKTMVGNKSLQEKQKDFQAKLLVTTDVFKKNRDSGALAFLKKIINKITFGKLEDQIYSVKSARISGNLSCLWTRAPSQPVGNPAANEPVSSLVL